jgi:hypothetical protein
MGETRLSATEAIDALLRVMPADLGADERLDWAEVSAQLGTGLPSDYKAFMSAYGGGSIGGDALSVLVPLPVEGPRWDPGCIAEATETMRTSWDAPGAEALLAWGAGDRGDTLGWLMIDRDPDAWPVVVYRHHLDPAWAVFECGMAEFLTRLMAADLGECPLSGDSLWGRRASFVHWFEEQRRWMAGLNPVTGEPDPLIRRFAARDEQE